MARQGGLGRGLGALIPARSVDGDDESVFQELPVSAISPNRRQPRTQFDEESLAALTASVRELGVLQPIVVRLTGPGEYELVAGERRWRAAKRAGLPMVPAVIRSADDASSLEQALVENLQREDLNPLDEAAAYQQLIEDFHLTHDEVAARVGRSRTAISNTLRLFQLPPAVQRLLVEGRISAGHARALLGSPDRGFQESLARRAADQGLSVRAVEDAVRRRAEGETPSGIGQPPEAPGPAAGGRLPPPGLLELEELLAAHLATRVTVQLRSGKGRLTVEFADLEDLERIFRAMTGPQPRPAPPPPPAAPADGDTG